jgi:hypothetical protein
VAETDFARFSPHTPIAQARVNVTGGLPSEISIADDGSIAHALPRVPASTPQPPPPAPTEQEFRDKLTTAIAHERETADRLAEAKAACDRAGQHLQACEAAMREFANLDDEIKNNFIAQIRTGVAPATTEALRQRNAAQAAAHSDHLGASNANVAFQREQAEAQAAATEASVQVERLCARILGFAAERIADQHAALLAEAAKLVERLAAFDQFVTRMRAPLPNPVRHVLGNAPVNLAMRRDPAEWVDAAAALRANPQGEQQ